MSYTILDPQPPARSAELEADEIGPGLYPGEIAVDLGDGYLAAAAVEVERLRNGEGVVLTARARAIEADGTSMPCARLDEIATAMTHRASVAELERDGIDALAREALLIVLGEPPTMVTRDNPPPPDPQDPPEGWTEEYEAELLPISDLARQQASIRHAIEVAEAILAASDPAALLAQGEEA